MRLHVFVCIGCHRNRVTAAAFSLGNGQEVSTHGTKINRLKESIENGGKVSRRMQHANDFDALPGRSVEDEIVLKSSHRHDACALQIRAPKLPDTAHAWQCDQLRTR